VDEEEVTSGIQIRREPRLGKGQPLYIGGEARGRRGYGASLQNATRDSTRGTTQITERKVVA